MEYRIEKDTMGEMQVPADRYWAAQTQRSYQNFRIGNEIMPREITRAFGILKKAAALANCKLGKLSNIARATDKCAYNYTNSNYNNGGAVFNNTRRYRSTKGASIIRTKRPAHKEPRCK